MGDASWEYLPPIPQIIMEASVILQLFSHNWEPLSPFKVSYLDVWCKQHLQIQPFLPWVHCCQCTGHTGIIAGCSCRLLPWSYNPGFGFYFWRLSNWPDNVVTTNPLASLSRSCTSGVKPLKNMSRAWVNVLLESVLHTQHPSSGFLWLVHYKRKVLARESIKSTASKLLMHFGDFFPELCSLCLEEKKYERFEPEVKDKLIYALQGSRLPFSVTGQFVPALPR